MRRSVRSVSCYSMTSSFRVHIAGCRVGGTLPLLSIVQNRVWGSVRGPALFICLLLGAHLLCSAQPASQSRDRGWQAYSDSLVPLLPDFVQATLKRIPDSRRRLLAMGSYFRRRDSLELEWAWTSKQVAQFKQTGEYARMLVEIEKVKQMFAQENPGYSLGVNIGARSLETQIGKWNSVRSVGKSAGQFLDSCRAAMADTLLFPELPDSASLLRFRQFLEVCELDEDQVPTVAVPGLSKHGQLRAFDFKVMKGRRLIAGTTSATIPSLWDGAGWTEKLHRAVTAASDRFEGPLPSPYEPWHYTYLMGDWEEHGEAERGKPEEAAAE